MRGEDLTMNRRCKKCGCLLAETNKSKICSECRENIIRNTKLISIILVGVLIIGISIGIYLWSIKKYPITYEDCIIQVVDKRKEATHMYSGKSIVSTTKYYLLFDDGKELRVSSAIYNKTNIDEYIIITYSYQKGRVIGTSIKFNKSII